LWVLTTVVTKTICLLEYIAVWSVQSPPHLLRKILPPSSGFNNKPCKKGARCRLPAVLTTASLIWYSFLFFISTLHKNLQAYSCKLSHILNELSATNALDTADVWFLQVLLATDIWRSKNLTDKAHSVAPNLVCIPR
jgi:hypothetical protein